MGINRTNCKNCGAPLKYDLNNRIATCQYCNTEYHLDNLGRIEEYKVELEIMGQKRIFYIDCVTIEPVYVDVYRTISGEICITRENDIIELKLTSY